MKFYLVIFVLFALDPIGKLDRVARQNALKKEAREAFAREDFKTAIEKYQYLQDSLSVRDDNILLNLANAQYKIADSSNALGNYQKLTSSANKNLQSIAYQQLGVMNNKPQNQQQALDYFKKALKADPSNEEARYNYELLKKLMKEQQNQEDQKKDDKNKDQQDKKDQEKQDQEKDEKEKQEKDQQQKDQDKREKQDQEQKEQQQDQQQQKDQQQEQSQDQQDAEEKKDDQQKEGEQQDQEKNEGKKDKKEEIPPSTYKKLQEMKISPEKAKMILEAMKNQEVQYIQQNRKKARSRSKNDKPDW